MSKNNSYDPFESFLKLSELWEKQMNQLIFLWSNNNEFVRLAKLGTESHSRYLDRLRKNQELLASIFNVPTKNDVANVAKLTAQTEEKIDALEEQIWGLQDSLSSTNKEIDNVIDVSRDIVKLTKQMKTELQKTKKEIAATKKLEGELLEMKRGLSQLDEIKLELDELKKLMQKEKVEEPELVGAGQP